MPAVPFADSLDDDGAAGSATRPNASLVISFSSSLSFRASDSCFSISSSFRASSSLSSSSLVSSSPPAPSEDDPALDEVDESGLRRGDRVFFGPWRVSVDDDETFLAGPGYGYPAELAERGLCTGSMAMGERSCASARP